MPIEITKRELMQVVSGRGSPAETERTFKSVQFDSRLLRSGELFVALKGEGPRHGHQYVESALAAGAAMALVEDESLIAPSKYPDRIIVVDDTLIALQQIANFWRKRIAKPVVGVTGSVGKTTTKELLASILGQRGSGTQSQKSFNNHIGVPVTICSAGPEDRWLTLEMGMNHAGELDILSRIAEPDVAVITLIAPVHMFSFPSINEVADAKCEIFNGISKDGTAVLNRDDGILLSAAARRASCPNRRIYFGTHADSDVRLQDVRSRGLEGIEFTLSSGPVKEEFFLPMLGRHNALNAAAAIAAARAVFPDLSTLEVRRALELFKPPPMRLNVRHLANGTTIIDDSYNANPEAVRALLELVEDLRGPKTRIGFLIGDMLELGETALQHHTAIAEQIVAKQPAFVVAVGEFAGVFEQRAKKAGINSASAQTADEAAEIIRKFEFDLLLVKGSRGIALDKAVTILAAHFGENPRHF